MDRAVFDRMEAIDSSHWWFVARRRIVDALIAAHAPAAGRPLRLLEVGCGTGSNLAMLQRFGTVDAVEPDAHARAVAAARGGIAVTGGYLPDGVAIADGAYDLILMLDVLEHVADDHGALVRLRRALAPGGRLVLTVPAAPWMWSGHDVEHHHHRRYTAPQLTATLAAAGFRVRHRTHYNSLLYPLIAAVRLLGRLRGREGGDDAQPSGAVNATLGAIFALERRWIGHARVPFGVSLAAVAEAA